jgi:hypothetical protein
LFNPSALQHTLFLFIRFKLTYVSLGPSSKSFGPLGDLLSVPSSFWLVTYILDRKHGSSTKKRS